MKIFFSTRKDMRNFSATTPLVTNGSKISTRKTKVWGAVIKSAPPK